MKPSNLNITLPAQPVVTPPTQFQPPQFQPPPIQPNIPPPRIPQVYIDGRGTIRTR
jgi:hypothetical protein